MKNGWKKIYPELLLRWYKIRNAFADVKQYAFRKKFHALLSLSKDKINGRLTKIPSISVDCYLFAVMFNRFRVLLFRQRKYWE